MPSRPHRQDAQRSWAPIVPCEEAHGILRPTLGSGVVQRCRFCSETCREEACMAGFLKEFREFAVKGNVVDLAVGIIIGAAFGTIVTSLVNDVITPPLGLLIGGVDFTQLAVTLTEGVPGIPAAPGVAAVPEVKAVVLSYGKFVQTIFDFTIKAFAIFLLVKGINSLKRKEEAAPSAPAAPPRQEVLLEQIRDLLMKRT